MTNQAQTEKTLTVEEIAHEICIAFISLDIADEDEGSGITDEFDFEGEALDLALDMCKIKLRYYDDFMNDIGEDDTIEDVAKLVHRKLYGESEENVVRTEEDRIEDEYQQKLETVQDAIATWKKFCDNNNIDSDRVGDAIAELVDGHLCK